MEFDFTSSQRSLRADILAFAKEELTDALTARDRDCEFDLEAWKRIANFGFIKGFLPQEFGGEEWDCSTKVTALEALGYGCRDNGLLLALSSLVWTVIPPILSLGSEEQKSRYLPALASGECLAADGITEMEAGSDALAMKTLATPVPGGYKIDGEKTFIGFAPIADLILLYAKTNPGLGAWGVSAFLVETSLPGVHRSENKDKMGLRTLPTGDVRFDNCVVPQGARLGEEGVGLSLFNDAMEWERSFILATHVGAMAHQLESCAEYARSRHQFGKPIGSNQSVSNRIADMKMRLETSRLLMYKTAWMKDQGKSAALEASMTKLCISEAFVASSLDAIRIHGAKGYMTEFQIERDLRDSTGSLIYAGTSDIQRNLIARHCGV